MVDRIDRELREPPSYRPQRRAGGLDPDIKRMGLVALALGGGVVVLAGLWSFAGHHHGGVPVIEAAAGPVREKPVDPGGMKLAAGDDIGTEDGQDALAPPAEAPQIGALEKELKPATPAATGTDEDEDAEPQPTTAAVPSGASAARTADAAAVAAALPSPTTAAPLLAPNASVAASAPGLAASEPAPQALASAASTRGAQVQLAAMDSEKAAFDEWARLDKKMPGLLGARKPVVERTAIAGRPMYRLRTGGFADLAAASGFCEQVREQGGECSIAAF